MTECPCVVISILNWNGWRDTLECLESVRRLDYPNYLSVVVDNGSWDGSAERIKAWAHENLGAGHVLADYTQETALQGGDPQTEEALERVPSPAKLVLIRNKENLGFTGGNNLSISYALRRGLAADYVFFLNNDACLEPDCLAQLVAADRRVDAAMIGAALRPAGDRSDGGKTCEPNAASANEQFDGRFKEGGSRPHGLDNRQISENLRKNSAALDADSDLKPAGWVSGAALLMRRDLLEGVKQIQGNYLDDRLFLYGEDDVLSSLACRLGYKPRLARRAVGYHQGRASSGGDRGPCKWYYSTRNLFYIADYMPRFERLRFRLIYPLIGAGRVVKYLLTGRQGSARAALWGMIDAYRGVTGKWRDHDREANPGRRGGLLKNRERPSMPQAKVAIVHPRLGCTGSEATVLWTAEALKDRYDVTLISGGPTDLCRLNAYYGTNLKEGEVSILREPMPPGLRNSARFDGLRWAFTHRFCRRVAPGFDLMINGYGPADFGPRGFHYIADFGFDAELSRTFNPLGTGERDWWYGPSLWRTAYTRLCETVSSMAGGHWEHNLTIANSNWTADLMRQRYGVESVVIYPPVVGQFPDVPFENREAGFVCLGRITPAKRVRTIIEILDRVRRKGHDIHLHVVGGLESSEYCRSVQALSVRHRDWVFLEGTLFQTAKSDLISRHRFGIHACLMEAFGIAVAEMVKGGCIVFVPNSGGQVEIVNHPALVFENEGDAVEKIDAVLTREAEQETLRAHLRHGSQRFSQEIFQAQVRQLVEGLLKEPIRG